MSEPVGAAEREALARARADLVAQRRAYHRRLQAIAALGDLGLAVAERLAAGEDLADTTPLYLRRPDAVPSVSAKQVR